jgi:tRNA A-37 threonylcarbamoyl transferase component Bud32
METMDATSFEQQILKLGLVGEGQLAEIHEEIGEGADLSLLISALERKSYLTPWQRGKVLKGDFDGFFLGGYRILYKISSGSFGRVFRAEDPRDGRVVAIKILRRRWSEDQQRIDLFIREGKVGLTLKQPNIVEVLAISRDASTGQYYIVMEFIEGGNLREILAIRKKLTVAESLRIIEDAAGGLAYAYARGMTHRDIKLTNLLISSTGEAKLVDFGLAQFFASFAREEEKVDRTVDYAGLERATAVKFGDVRSDIYFLGCVLYECLTGRSPLVMTRDKHARMRKERFEQVQPIHPEEIEGPSTVLALVETMMALDPRQRYQTPAQLLDAIRAMRREVDSKSGRGGRPLARTVFVVESDDHLQDLLRDGLKGEGYRVLMAGDPLRALDRFRQQPFDGLIVDARTTGEEGLVVFENVLDEAVRKNRPCAALLLLKEDQASWEARVPQAPHVAVIVQEVKYNKLLRKLKQLMTEAHGPDIVAPPVFEGERARPIRRALEELPDEQVPDYHRVEDTGQAASAIDALLDDDDGPQPQASKPSWQAKSPPMRPLHHPEPPVSVPAHDPRGWRDELGPDSPKKDKDKTGPRTRLSWANLTPTQKAILLGVIVVPLLALLVYILIPSGITEGNFDKIENGMSEEQVESILGPGQEIPNMDPTAKDVKGKSSKLKRWQRGGIRIVVIFSDGKVSMKNMTSD